MSEATLERRMERVERAIKQILHRMDNRERKSRALSEEPVLVTKLTARERRLVDQALKDAKEGKLILHDDLRKKLGV